MSKAPLRTLRNSNIFELYQKLLTREELSRAQSETLLSAAVLFLNHENPDVAALGYRIVVMYANATGDYVPLYDVAIGRGFMPIVDSVESSLAAEEASGHFFPEYFSSLLELFEVEDAVFTEQQLDLRNFFKEHNLTDVTVTAPTSYGKSELISGFCNTNLESNICVLVPTKALLAQTKQRLLKKRLADDNRQIITHAEMYQGGDQNVIAVLTQERLLRFFIKHPSVNFDFVFVDEAHNLLGKDSRALLLAKVIILQKRRNPAARFKYLTPFLVDQTKLQLRYAAIEPTDYKVKEGLKTERYYVVDCREGEAVNIYDQYFDRFVQCSDYIFDDELQLVIQQAAKKNIIFFNLPKKIEQFMRAFLARLDDVESESITRVCESISDFLHSEYLLVEGLRKGVLYHHGSVPDIVKLYIERAYTEIPEIRHIVCNSTLLEGVNIPAERMFILENKKGQGNLTKSQFRNLVGRVCRFSEIFSRGSSNLGMLEPEIYLVGSNAYLDGRANLRKFIKTVAQVDLKIEDEVDNVLLEEVLIEDDVSKDRKREADEFLENVLPGTTGLEVARAVTPVGRSCFLNNVSEIDILQHETQIQNILDDLIQPLQSSNEVLELIGVGFMPFLKDGAAFDTLRRIKEESAQTFYAMLIDWKIRGAAYAEMIGNFLRYWEGMAGDEVYVGKWGDIAREGSYRPSWVIISEKSHAEQVNLAIVRIKEEQDFVDNHLLKYVELLNDLGKLDEELYLQIKFGTTNQDKIRLMNFGVNSFLAGKLIDNYADFVDLEPDSGVLKLRPELIEQMRQNRENEILVFEAGMHLGLAHEF
ncbi:MAG: DEAD/DEAH box helicase [Paracoccaceae bacterium]